MKRSSAFTLIEMLIALVVVAMAGIVVSSTVGGISTQTFGIERRQMAHWVGENHLVRLKLDLRQRGGVPPEGRDTDRLRMGDRQWELRTEIKATTYPQLRRVEITVFELEEGRPVGPLDSLTAFVGS